MGVTYARGSITGKSETREYDFLVDTGATWVGIPQADIDALGLDAVPNASAEIVTGNGVIRTPMYIAVGMLEGTGFVDAAVPAPIPLVGYMLLQALGFKVDCQPNLLVGLKRQLELTMIDRVLLRSILILMLPVMVAAVLLTGCGSNAAPELTATPDIDATVNAKVSQALGTPIAQPTVIRPGHCGRLCDQDFLPTAGLEEVRSELNRGTDIEARGNLGWTPLHIAAGFNTEPAVIALLLDRGADIAAKGDFGWTPLHAAAGNNSEPAVVLLLLDRSADIEAKDNDGSTPLFSAAAFNTEAAVIALLLQRGADMAAANNFGQTPLHGAARKNTEPAVVVLLLDHGAGIEARTVLGSTPLHAAAGFNGESSVIALLLDRGADIESRDNESYTPLHDAVALNTETSVIELLVDRGADITSRTTYGETACQIAERENRETDIRRLLCR